MQVKDSRRLTQLLSILAADGFQDITTDRQKKHGTIAIKDTNQPHIRYTFHTNGYVRRIYASGWGDFDHMYPLNRRWTSKCVKDSRSEYGYRYYYVGAPEGTKISIDLRIDSQLPMEELIMKYAPRLYKYANKEWKYKSFFELPALPVHPAFRYHPRGTLANWIRSVSTNDTHLTIVYEDYSTLRIPFDSKCLANEIDRNGNLYHSLLGYIIQSK